MKHILKIIFVAMFITSSMPGLAAVDIVECENEEGDRSFQKTCPPGSMQIGSKKINTGETRKTENTNSTINATMYMVPDCEACEETREYLNSMNIPIKEINVDGDAQLQKELAELTGSLKVPATIIGEEVITGYSRTKLKEALASAGYEEAAE